MADILGLAQYVQQQGAIGKQAGQQSRLAKLYSSALAAPDDQRDSFLPQMAAESPEAAFKAQGQFGDMRKQAFDDLGREAGMFVALAQSGDPAMTQQAYARLAQRAQAAGHPVPPNFDPKMLPMIEKLASTIGGGGDDLKSLRIGANGNYWAIRGGQFIDTGTPADPKMQLRDQPGIAPGLVNLRDGSVLPLGGAPQQQRAPGEVPFSIDPSLPPEVQADIRANEPQYAQAPDQSQVSIGGAPAQSGPAATRPASAPISPYQQQTLEMQRERMRIAQEAAGSAAAAKRAAEEVRANQKQEVANRRQADSAESASQLVAGIDSLMQSPGYHALGTVFGDAQINTPLVRNDAKDADAQLKNVAGQVALATMAKLKALSSQGATGFGSLSAPELKLLQNAIATLQSENISNAQLTKSLKIIRGTMDKVANWKPQGSQQAPQGGGNVIRYDAQGNRIQ